MNEDMVLNFMVMGVVSKFTSPPPQEVQDALMAIRSPLVERLGGADEPPPDH